MNVDLLKHQGVMIVESDILDKAFADVDYSPRQRLINTEIDFERGKIDCGRLLFADEDSLILKAVHTGAKREGSLIYYEPWKIYLGYYDQPKEEMTQMVGYPQMEVPEFPEEGPRTISIRLFSATALLKKNCTPDGSVDHWLELAPKTPMMSALTRMAEAYKCTPSFSAQMITVIEKMDEGINLRAELAEQYSGYQLDQKTTYVGGQQNKPSDIAEEWNRETVNLTFAGTAKDDSRLENDYEYMSRIMSKITSVLQSDIIPIEESHIRPGMFGDVTVGNVSRSDVVVVWGIQGTDFVISLASELIEKYGFPGIPVLQYKEGNGLIRSAKMTIVESESQGLWASFIKTFTGRDDASEGAVETQNPLPETYAGIIPPSESSINSYDADKYIRVIVAPINAPGSGEMTIDGLKRALESKLTGTIETFGIPKLLDGQLVALTGLGQNVISEPTTENSDDQNLAYYSRVYLVKKVTHKMDAKGTYMMSMEVEGCTLDGSDNPEMLKELLQLLSSGIGEAGGAASWWKKLFELN